TNYVFARKEGHPVDKAFDFATVVRSAHSAIMPLLLPVIVVGGLIGGIFTPTEAAAVGVLMALVFGIWRRELSWKIGYKLLVDSTYQTASVMMILAGSAVLGQVLANEQIPQRMVEAMGGLTNTAFAFLLL